MAMVHTNILHNTPAHFNPVVVGRDLLVFGFPFSIAFWKNFLEIMQLLCQKTDLRIAYN